MLHVSTSIGKKSFRKREVVDANRYSKRRPRTHPFGRKNYIYRHCVRGEEDQMQGAQIEKEPRTCRQLLFTTLVKVQLLMPLFSES